ncbi:glycosyltransferase [uncultured Photobacterium sp.]|uniref:glycosyltransferase family 2 protein n=1 Tax=uncultured Photobacterium sp. TaxID=173973 RepID=UPI002601D5A5|nr:glycosyltransferase [uncultured Photobacterium sp.]
MNPKISVIIAAYNAETHIRDTIESLLSQTYTNLEIIIIDDGSTDSTSNIINTISQNNINVKIKRIENNGVSNARNIGINIAQGEYISFLDADDIIDNDFYAELYNQSNNKNIVCAQNIYNMYSLNNIKPWPNNLKLQSDFFKNRICVYVWGKLYKKNFLDENMIRFDSDIKIGEDFLFNITCLKYLENDDVEIINNKERFLYRITEQSLSNKVTLEALKNRKHSADSIYCIIKEKYNSESALYIYINTYLKTMFIKLLKEKQFSVLFSMLKLESENELKLSFHKIHSLSISLKDKLFVSIILLLINTIRITL